MFVRLMLGIYFENSHISKVLQEYWDQYVIDYVSLSSFHPFSDLDHLVTDSKSWFP